MCAGYARKRNLAGRGRTRRGTARLSDDLGDSAISQTVVVMRVRRLLADDVSLIAAIDRS
jgi:hypothetical protein